MIKLIAIDLDGTLLSSNGSVSHDNIMALKEARNKGVSIVLCTGRPYFAMEHLCDEIDLKSDEDYIITFNGGQVQKAATGEVIKAFTLSLDELTEWTQLARQLRVPLNIIDDSFVYYTQDSHQTIQSEYLSERPHLPSKQIKHITQFDADKVFNKFVICIESTCLDEVIQQIPEKFYQRYSIFKSRDNLLEIVHKKVTKGNILKELASSLNIKAEQVMAIGDQENDLSMLEYAGVAVAMGNAIDKVKHIADFITDSNDHHGVAKAIQHYIN